MLELSPFALLALGAVFTVLWWLLRSKDAEQAEKIKLLFEKHDEDYAELQALKLQIASQHYVKGELDTKFDKLEVTFRDGFLALGTKFDTLSNALLTHMSQESSQK